MLNPRERPGAPAEVVPSLLVLCRGRSPEGVPCWAYLCLMPSQAHLLNDLKNTGKVELSDYGTVLEAGTGENPPPEISRHMQERYGIRDDFQNRLLEAINMLEG